MEQTIEINKVIMGGLGLGRAADGMAVMVAGVLPGETVTVAATRAHRSHLEARLVRVDTPSPDRITPPCPLSTTCGGCDLQHAAYPAQLRLKQAIVQESLTRARVPLPVGGVDNRGLSRVAEVVSAADTDPLTFHGRVAARTGAQFYATIQAAEAGYAAITLPALVLHGEADRVVPCAGGVRLFEGLGSADKTLRLFPGGYHELWNDLDQEAFLREVTGWICARAAAPSA